MFPTGRGLINFFSHKSYNNFSEYSTFYIHLFIQFIYLFNELIN